MKRFLLGFVAAIGLAFPVALFAAGPQKPPPTTTVVSGVSNPMTADLNGGGYSVANVQSVYASNLFSAGEIVSGQQGYNGVVQLSTPAVSNGPGVMAGDDDPSVIVQTGMPRGSIYLRSNGEWWRKSGDGALDWTKVAG